MALVASRARLAVQRPFADYRTPDARDRYARGSDQYVPASHTCLPPEGMQIPGQVGSCMPSACYSAGEPRLWSDQELMIGGLGSPR